MSLYDRKIILTTLIALFFLMNMSVLAFPNGVSTNNFKPNNESVPDEVIEIGGTIYNAMTTIGIVVSVIVLIIIGIKYMMGSVEEKAEYKKTMIPYIVGAFLVGSSSVIISIFEELMG